MLFGVALAIVGLWSAPASGLGTSTRTVPLDPIGPPRYGGDQCPEYGHYWNFVLDPTDGSHSIVEVVLNLAGTEVTFSGAEIIRRAGTDDVYIEVPRGYGLELLRHDGSLAVVSPGDGSPAPSFRLRHLCYRPLAPGSTTTTTAVGVPPTTDPTVDDVAIDAICYEVDVTGATVTYWYRVTNRAAAPVSVNWPGGAAAIAPGGSIMIPSDAPSLTVRIDGVTRTEHRVPGDRCEIVTSVSKVVAGPERPTGGPAPVYTVQVSRLVGDVYVPEGPRFEIVGGQTVEIPLPSTFDPEGIRYRITEVDSGDADAVAITPETFLLHGHRTETVAVGITNGFAAIELSKTVDAAMTLPATALVYELIAENTGGLTLDPVTIYDRLPAQVTFTSATVAAGVGTCTLAEATRPQLVRCDLTPPLAPGGRTPAVEIEVMIDVDAVAGEPLVNQAMVIGDFGGGGAPALHPGAQTESPSCLPAAGEVCDLAAAASGVFGSAAPTTAVESRTPFTTVISDAGGSTSSVPLDILPATGLGRSASLSLLGLVFVTIGGALVVTGRRDRLDAVPD